MSEEDCEKYPLVLTSGGRNISMFHSEHRQIPTLRSINPWPKVTMHPETAKKHGIADGDWVKVENQFGSAIQRANVNETVDPRVVHVEHAWWYPEQDGEAPNLYGNFKSNANELVPHESIGILGYGAPYKNMVCNITRVDSLEG